MPMALRSDMVLSIELLASYRPVLGSQNKENVLIFENHTPSSFVSTLFSDHDQRRNDIFVDIPLDRNPVGTYTAGALYTYSRGPTLRPPSVHRNNWP